MHSIEQDRRENGWEKAAGTSENWRDAALNAALLAISAEHRDGKEVILEAMRRSRPLRATMTTYLDRVQLLDFLTRRCTGFRSLLDGHDDFIVCDAEKKMRPFIGWYAAEWEGETIEFAFPPSASKAGAVIGLARDEALLQRFADVMIDYVNRPAGRCLQFNQMWENAPDIDEEIGKVTWDDIVLPSETLGRLREAIEGFFQHKQSYLSLGFPWKRGVLLIGPPGTGKTMVCKAVAAALPDLPFLYVRDVPSFRGNQGVKAIFERARQVAPCILAFEDMDGLITPENRSVFLNELDGFQNNEGLLIIASSNHPGKIDEALLRRPSRFDRVFHLGLPALEERTEFCRRILARFAVDQQFAPSLDWQALAQDAAAQTDGFTPAYLKEVFISSALQRAQSGATILDEAFTEAVIHQIEELRQHMRHMRDPDALAEMRTNDGPIGLRR